jgi:hypothetical protein
VYKPDVLMSPGLRELPAGAATDQVTPVLNEPVPETVAENCTWVPTIAVLGETEIDVIVGPV